jgi:eukaryotic-like serine/threonine-protein kinase
MATLSPNEWQAVSPYLDQALAMSGDERAVWLRSLAEHNPTLVAQLTELLEEHQVLSQEGFLEKGGFGLPNSASLAGQMLGPYTLISQIGQGGMGSVWLAERNDGRFERRVAVKFIHIALMGKGGEARFKREGSILGRLAHPHIAELVDAGVSTAGQPYLVLEYVEGENIDRYCDHRTLDVESRIRLFLCSDIPLRLSVLADWIYQEIRADFVAPSSECSGDFRSGDSRLYDFLPVRERRTELC